MSRCKHRFPVFSFAVRLYHPLLAVGLLVYTLCLRRGVGVKFLVVSQH